jgi:hypothetical protein
MPRQKGHSSRVNQVIGEPGPGTPAVGYVHYSSGMQNPASIVTQKRRLQAVAA